MDLGSGDGRTVITAAKRGATAVGVEFNPDMVELSKENAAKESVTAKAAFVKADLFETDFSKATVITMFLLPEINIKLRPKILSHEAGHARRLELLHDGRLGGGPDGNRQQRVHELVHCAISGSSRRKSRARGQTPQGDLKITQTYQKIAGTLGTTKIEGKMIGDQITFTAGKTTYTGRVNGTTIQGTAPGAWTATKREARTGHSPATMKGRFGRPPLQTPTRKTRK